jgi:F-type H+-transporting ATPase subunit epsilon
LQPVENRGEPVTKELHVDLVSVDEKVWSGGAEMLIARTTEGELGILPGHTPLLGQLAEPSQVRIRRPEGDLAYDVAGGFLSVTAQGVTVLAESCQPATARADQ